MINEINFDINIYFSNIIKLKLSQIKQPQFIEELYELSISDMAGDERQDLFELLDVDTIIDKWKGKYYSREEIATIIPQIIKLSIEEYRGKKRVSIVDFPKYISSMIKKLDEISWYKLKKLLNDIGLTPFCVNFSQCSGEKKERKVIWEYQYGENEEFLFELEEINKDGEKFYNLCISCTTDEYNEIFEVFNGEQHLATLKIDKKWAQKEIDTIDFDKVFFIIPHSE